LVWLLRADSLACRQDNQRYCCDNSSLRRDQWLIVPFLLVSMSADAPDLNRNALMFFVRKDLA